ncbi:hypothetical protein ACTG16_23575 [Aeromonas sp. 23P]|uniref:hypothetical protein n=1 Tax=Aeromonas sp. 23P TaxID=3452716 RepID=UPI003F793C26|nr:hypothetical protein [Aeromonas veronii]
MNKIYYPREIQEAIASLKANPPASVPANTPDAMQRPDFFTNCRFFSLEEREQYKCAFTLGIPGPAHKACASHMSTDKGHNPESLFIGYAMSYSGAWIPHTFIVEDDRHIIEPDNELMLCYLGVELTGDDLERFISMYA